MGIKAWKEMLSTKFEKVPIVTLRHLNVFTSYFCTWFSKSNGTLQQFDFQKHNKIVLNAVGTEIKKKTSERNDKNAQIRKYS